MTQQENCKKSAKDRNYTFVSNNNQNRRFVRATNINTNEVSYFNSLYSVNQHLGINAGNVKMVCEGINSCKTGISKKDSCRYKFDYIKEEDLPENYVRSTRLGSKRL